MLAGEIRDKAMSLGFGDVGFADVTPFAGGAEEMARRIRTEASMRPVWERYRIASDPSAVMPGAKTVVVMAWPYAPYTGWPEGYLRWSAYYECRIPARKAMAALVAWLRERGVTAVEDNDQVPLKEAAVRAGLGTIGLNQLLITPEWGSCVYLGAVLIDREITERREPPKPLPCGKCQRCVKACPTNALECDGTFTRQKCLRHHMLSGDTIPETVRGYLHNDLVGCDACQGVCPLNHGQYKGERSPEPDVVSPFSIAGVLDDWKTGLKARLARMAPVIGANYARADKVLAAALIAARDCRELTTSVGGALYHPRPHIRRYAAWALSLHGGEEAWTLLGDALNRERDPAVIEEIKTALERRADAGKDIK